MPILSEKGEQMIHTYLDEALGTVLNSSLACCVYWKYDFMEESSNPMKPASYTRLSGTISVVSFRHISSTMPHWIDFRLDVVFIISLFFFLQCWEAGVLIHQPKVWVVTLFFPSTLGSVIARFSPDAIKCSWPHLLPRCLDHYCPDTFIYWVLFYDPVSHPSSYLIALHMWVKWKPRAGKLGFRVTSTWRCW